jgi:hypothetical protein
MRGGNSLLTCKSFKNELLQQLEVNIPAWVALDDGGKNGSRIRHTCLERCLEVHPQFGQMSTGGPMPDIH